MEAAFRVNGVDYEIPSDLTLGEMCDAEKFFGVEFGNNETSGVRMAAAMLWIAIARVDKTVTVADVRALPPDVFESFNAAGDDVPPPSAADASDSAAITGGDLNNGGDGQDGTLEVTGAPS